MTETSGAATDVAHCYRHPDRRAGVSCQRCDRPICPSCMITASVGFQCPECVKGSPQAKVATTLRHNATPYVTYTLIAINFAVFLLGLVQTRSGGGDEIFQNYALGGNAVHAGEWWRIFTGGFLHADIIHIGFNMYALYALGPALESLLGRAKFLALFTTCLVGGSAGALLLTDPSVGTVGASGAIFGLFGALIMLQVSRGINPLQNSLGMVLLLNLVLTFTISNISVGGHLGGLATGIVAGGVTFGTRQHPIQPGDPSSGVRTAFVVVLGIALAIAAVFIAYSVNVDPQF